jgi:hypothetical protein
MFHILSTVAFILNVFLFSRQATATGFALDTKKKKWKTGKGRGETGEGRRETGDGKGERGEGGQEAISGRVGTGCRVQCFTCSDDPWIAQIFYLIRTLGIDSTKSIPCLGIDSREGGGRTRERSRFQL